MGLDGTDAVTCGKTDGSLGGDGLHTTGTILRWTSGYGVERS